MISTGRGRGRGRGWEWEREEGGEGEKERGRGWLTLTTQVAGDLGASSACTMKLVTQVACTSEVHMTL